NSGGPCALVVRRGGLLTIERSRIDVRGPVYLEEGGMLRLVDCEMRLANGYAREFGYWFAGGRLDTERTLIGGTASASGSPLVSNFHLAHGLWTARDTTVQYCTGVLLFGSRMGNGWTGGRLEAD